MTCVVAKMVGLKYVFNNVCKELI